jgi:uncharacterized protein (DUF2252 family)
MVFLFKKQTAKPWTLEALIESIYQFNSIFPAELTELKYLCMRKDLFRFFRGTCHIFYQNWSTVASQFLAPLTWICGDLHLENFGSYKAENKMVYFDLNDFDEAILAPATWEVARMLTSIFIAFETLGIAGNKSERVARQFLKTYSQTLACGRCRYIDPRIANGIVEKFLRSVEKRKPTSLLKKKTGKKARIKFITLEHPKHLKLKREKNIALMHLVQDWVASRSESPNNYQVLDVVFRVAGTGSIGLERYAFLLKSKNRFEKYLLLDMKEVKPSSAAPFINWGLPQFKNEAERVIHIQQLMQNVSPALLSGVMYENKCFLLQEMQPAKDYIDFKLLKHNYREMLQVISDMGMLTASAQLRSSGRNGAANADELISFGKDDRWQKTLIDYAATQVDFYKMLYRKFCEEEATEPVH